MAARFNNGRWSRNIPRGWANRGVWRTDMFKTVLTNQLLQVGEFILTGGPRVLIPASELRRVLIGGRDRYAGQIWGLFDIDPVHRTVAGQPVQMKVIP